MLKIDFQNYNIITNTNRLSVGDVFFCHKNAEKYLSKEILSIPSVIVADIGFQSRMIKSDIISAEEIASLKTDIYEVSNLQEELILQLNKRYKIPSSLVAITGTKGKTSTAWFVMQMLGYYGIKCGYIGTIGVYIFDGTTFNKLNTKDTLSTPEIDEMYQYLDVLTANGANVIVFEATSHALMQHRIDGLQISCGCFTNLSQDHLDYHKSMEEYFNAKSLLFSKYIQPKSICILNADDERFRELLNICKIRKMNIITIGKKDTCDFQIKNIMQDKDKQRFNINVFNNEYTLTTQILGEFQIYNLVEAVAICVEKFNIPCETIFSFVPKITAPVGRMQQIANSKVFIDFAHTPKSLEESLKLLKTRYKKVAITFGCGGDRDKQKRPIMFQIALKLADFVIITSDNPRFEDPLEIIDDITCFERKDFNNALANDGFVKNEVQKIDALYKNHSNSDFIIIPDRDKAIYEIVNRFYHNNDYAILIAGKGHENYQIIKDKKIHFDDVETAINYINELK